MNTFFISKNGLFAHSVSFSLSTFSPLLLLLCCFNPPPSLIRKPPPLWCYFKDLDFLSIQFFFLYLKSQEDEARSNNNNIKIYSKTQTLCVVLVKLKHLYKSQKASNVNFGQFLIEENFHSSGRTFLPFFFLLFHSTRECLMFKQFVILQPPFLISSLFATSTIQWRHIRWKSRKLCMFSGWDCNDNSS